MLTINIQMIKLYRLEQATFRHIIFNDTTLSNNGRDIRNTTKRIPFKISEAAGQNKKENNLEYY